MRCPLSLTRLKWGANPQVHVSAVAPIVEQVSGNAVEFEMGSLLPGTRYKVGVHAVKEALKSNPAVTEFTTGRGHPHDAPPAVP